MLMSQSGTLVRTPVKDISVVGRNTQGVRLIRLEEGDELPAWSASPVSAPSRWREMQKAIRPICRDDSIDPSDGPGLPPGEA